MSAPVKKRGKEREKPKARKPSALRKVRFLECNANRLVVYFNYFMSKVIAVLSPLSAPYVGSGQSPLIPLIPHFPTFYSIFSIFYFPFLTHFIYFLDFLSLPILPYGRQTVWNALCVGNLQWAGICPPKSAFSRRGSGSPSKVCFLWPTRISHPNGILISSNVFA